MKNFRAYFLFSALGLLISLMPVYHCGAEPNYEQDSTDTALSVVFTFSAPAHDRINLADSLANTVLSALTAQPENIAQQIDVSGGGWALTSNLSGVQLALFATDNPWEIVNYALEILDRIPADTAQLLNSRAKTARNYEIVVPTQPWAHSQQSNFSISLSPSLQSYSTHLQVAADRLYELYHQQIDAIKIHTNSGPLMAKVMNWPSLDFNSFFSAKFIGEQFLRTFSHPQELTYEILYSHQGVYLALIVMGNESQLYKSFEPVNRFTAATDELSKLSWTEFKEKAEAILSEDSRDFRKTLLSEAWMKHFNHNLKQKSTDINSLSFIKPAAIDDHFSMPESFMLSFSRSDNQSPRIVAARQNMATPGIDTTIMMQGHTHTIDSIESRLNSDERPSFTFSSSRHASDTLVIHFYNTYENMPVLLREFHTFISNTATTFGPDNLNIAIASAGNLPPFVLRGMIESAWAGKSSTHHWAEATQQTFADLTGLPTDDTTAIHRRWKLITATPRGKTELLARLALAGRYINSFNLPLSKE